MVWLVYAFIVIIGAAGIHFFGKLGAGVVDPVVGMAYALGTSFLLSLLVLFGTGKMNMVSVASLKVMWSACAMGLCIALAHYAIFFMYRADAPLSVAVPIVRMGAVVLAVLAGFLFFHERIALPHIVGIVLSMVAVVLMTR